MTAEVWPLVLTLTLALTLTLNPHPHPHHKEDAIFSRLKQLLDNQQRLQMHQSVLRSGARSIQANSQQLSKHIARGMPIMSGPPAGLPRGCDRIVLSDEQWLRGFAAPVSGTAQVDKERAAAAAAAAVGRQREREQREQREHEAAARIEPSCMRQQKEQHARGKRQRQEVDIAELTELATTALKQLGTVHGMERGLRELEAMRVDLTGEVLEAVLRQSGAGRAVNGLRKDARGGPEITARARALCNRWQKAVPARVASVVAQPQTATDSDECEMSDTAPEGVRWSY
jgi:hypothetical protein